MKRTKEAGVKRATNEIEAPGLLEVSLSRRAALAGFGMFGANLFSSNEDRSLGMHEALSTRYNPEMPTTLMLARAVEPPREQWYQYANFDTPSNHGQQQNFQIWVSKWPKSDGSWRIGWKNWCRFTVPPYGWDWKSQKRCYQVDANGGEHLMGQSPWGDRGPRRYAPNDVGTQEFWFDLKQQWSRLEGNKRIYVIRTYTQNFYPSTGQTVFICDLYLSLPTWGALNLWLYSGVLGYKTFPVRNGRYKIRAASKPNMVATIPASGTDHAVGSSIALALFEGSSEIFDWFIVSSDGTNYYIVPTCSVGNCLNNAWGRPGEQAQSYPDRGGDDANVMHMEPVPGKKDTFRIRCKMGGAYLTYNGTSITFQTASGRADQEWVLDQQDKVYLTDEDLAAVDLNLTGGPKFTVTGNSSGKGYGGFAVDSMSSTGVGADWSLSGGVAPYPDRLQCGAGAYKLNETAVKPGYKSQGLSKAGQFAPHPSYEVNLVWVTQPKGRIPIHFMLNDENGDIHELHVEYLKEGTNLTTADACFATALEKIAGMYEPEVANCADRWYLGDEYEATDWNKKFDAMMPDKEVWIWARIMVYHIQVYVDGTDKSNLVFQKGFIPLGQEFTIPKDSLNKAVKPSCNLSPEYGTNTGSGFTGWYLNPELTTPAPTTVTSNEAKTIKLFARNRATLRVGYAPGSIKPSPDGDYRTAPRDDAPVYERAMQLPDFSSEPTHRLDGVDLPATGDWGEGHACGYYDEVLALPSYQTVYERLGDGRWRTYRTEGWTTEDAAPQAKTGKTRSLLGFRSASSNSGTRVQMKGDTTRVIRWVLGVVDGVETTR